MWVAPCCSIVILKGPEQHRARLRTEVRLASGSHFLVCADRSRDTPVTETDAGASHLLTFEAQTEGLRHMYE
jgi:hypothetical protein